VQGSESAKRLKGEDGKPVPAAAASASDSGSAAKEESKAAGKAGAGGAAAAAAGKGKGSAKRAAEAAERTLPPSVSSHPYPTQRGHTGYLTFACRFSG
jgi:hypothetical protein